jgi:hypothetical protein
VQNNDIVLFSLAAIHLHSRSAHEIEMAMFFLLSLIVISAFTSAQTHQPGNVQRRDLISDFAQEILKDLEDATECSACEVLTLQFKTSPSMH